MDTLADTLWAQFAIETEEHLDAVEPILAQAEAQPTSPPDIAQLFRSFHSIKGLARALDVAGMETVAHHAEDLLGLVRDGRAALTPPRAELLLHAVDALKRLRDVVTERRRDAPPDPALVARLDAACAEAGGDPAADVPAENASGAPAASVAVTPLHEDPEMLAIFVEMVRTRGPELCGALAATAGERAAARDAAETLSHAAEVMRFEALAAGFGGLRDRLQGLAEAGAPDAAARQDLIARLADVQIKIGVLGEIAGEDSGTAAFAAALGPRVADEPQRRAAALAARNRRLRDDLAAGDLDAAAAGAAEIARGARAIQAVAAALALPRIAELLLLIDNLYGDRRVIDGGVDAAALIEAADAAFAEIARHTTARPPTDIAEDVAGALAARLRAPLSPAARPAAPEGGRIAAGLHVPARLLPVMSDETFAALERGVASDGLLPYAILVHLEADRDTAARLIGWLTAEGRALTNRTVLNGGESWFEMLVLSPQPPAALLQHLAEIDPEGHCVKAVRRLTETPGGEVLLDESGPSGGDASGSDGAAAAGPGARPAPATLLRVSGDTVDGFLDDIGELRVAAARLTHEVRGLGQAVTPTRRDRLLARLPRELRAEYLAAWQDIRDRCRQLTETEDTIAGMLARLHQRGLDLRVVPAGVVFTRLPRIVHDLSHTEGKSVELVLEGSDVRIDKSVVDALADPLIHMVRNAVDHGIESPAERRAAGKPERGRLAVRAAQRGAMIEIEIADDGRGLDAAAIRSKAVARGLLPAAQAAMLADNDVFPLIFEAGLSTATQVTETSGRGVGMDIVLAAIRRFAGDVAIDSKPGAGTIFTLRLPLTAALQTALLVRVGGQSLALPERHVMSVVEIATATVRRLGSRRSVMHRGTVLPLYDLGDLLGLRGAGARRKESFAPVVVTGNGRQMIGLEVDAVERRQELFLKDLDPRLASFPGVGGASVLGDGRVVLVLDGEKLLQLAARGIEPPGVALQPGGPERAAS